MERPCARVPRERGETVRRALAEAEILDNEYDIETENGWLYIPVTDPSAVPSDVAIEQRCVSARESQTLPEDLLDETPSYERLGQIALIDEDDPAQAERIANALVSSSLPIRSVLNAMSKVKGRERIREWKHVVGDATETVHREYGAEFIVDVTEVYFSPRLATERHRVVEQVEPGERAFDMFAGVGPFAIPMAQRGAEVIAVDINPRAIEYLRQNIARNDVDRRVTAIEGDVRTIAAEYTGWADRIVMNLPHSAHEFLDSAATIAGADCVLHYYDIQPDDAPFHAGERAIRAAFEPAFEVSVLDTREVRSYAPHEVNVCLDVRLQRRIDG